MCGDFKYNLCEKPVMEERKPSATTDFLKRMENELGFRQNVKEGVCVLRRQVEFLLKMLNARLSLGIMYICKG